MFGMISTMESINTVQTILNYSNKRYKSIDQKPNQGDNDQPPINQPVNQPINQSVNKHPDPDNHHDNKSTESFSGKRLSSLQGGSAKDEMKHKKYDQNNKSNSSTDSWTFLEYDDMKNDCVYLNF